MEASGQERVHKGYMFLLCYSDSRLLACLKSYPGTIWGKMNHYKATQKLQYTQKFHPSSVKHSLFLISVTLLLEAMPAVTRRDARIHPGQLASLKQGSKI